MSDQNVPALPPDWLETIAKHLKSEARTKDRATEEMLRIQTTKVDEGATLPLMYYLRSGDKQQQHDSAKALGYIAKTGALTGKQKEDVRLCLLDVLQNKVIVPGVAFAAFEALERVDSDMFYSLVMKLYEDYVAKREQDKVDAVINGKTTMQETKKATERTVVNQTNVTNNPGFINLESNKKEG